MGAVLFDLGNTLVEYYTRAEWPAVAAECTESAIAHLRGEGVALPAADELRARMDAIRKEESERLRAGRDWAVWPMEDRHARVFFGGSRPPSPAVMDALCRAWLAPVFARARVVPDALSVLARLRDRGIPMAMVSNMPWGSPAAPWVDEVRRHGLLEFIPLFVTCRDAGWRKPDRRIFDLAAQRLGVPPGSCVFVGDEPVWDYEGAAVAGMRPVLFDPPAAHAGKGLTSIARLPDLEPLL